MEAPSNQCSDKPERRISVREVDLADVYSPGTVEIGLELRLSTGVRISRCQHAPSATAASCLSNVLLTLNLAGPYRLSSRIDGVSTEVEVPMGSMVLTPRGSSAWWRWDREVETLHIRFDQVLISEVALEMGHPCPGLVRIAPLEGWINEDAGSLAERLGRELSERKPGFRIASEALARALAIELVRAGWKTEGGHARAGAGRALAVFERVASFVQRHMGEPLPVAGLARETGLSPSQFNRVFKGACGLTPHQYVLRTRVACAKRLLLEGCTPARIAFDLGFADQSHLTHHFKRQVGVTPAAFSSGG